MNSAVTMISNDTPAHYLSVVIPHTTYTDMTFMIHRIGYPGTLKMLRSAFKRSLT